MLNGDGAQGGEALPGLFPPQPRLSLAVTPSLISGFFYLLQAGFGIKARVGVTVKDFLSEELQLTSEFIRERITTIFLDGSPVDDLDSAVIREGSRLALSGAMPGLVGAVMRREGFYASLRSTITYRGTEESFATGEGTIHLRLFNVVMEDLGPEFLRRGIFVRSPDLSDFLARQGDEFFRGCEEVFLDGRPVESGRIREREWLSESDSVYLSVVARL